MDVLEAIGQRRSIKSFSDAPLSRETLLKLADLARSSPSGANKNPWRFVIITQKEALQRLGQTHRACQWLGSAQVGIAIVADPTVTKYWLEDCCVAAYSIWLAATGMGLGAAWAAMYQSDNAEESARRQTFVREVLAIPAGLSVPMILGLGHPQATPAPGRCLH